MIVQISFRASPKWEKKLFLNNFLYCRQECPNSQTTDVTWEKAAVLEFYFSAHSRVFYWLSRLFLSLMVKSRRACKKNYKNDNIEKRYRTRFFDKICNSPSFYLYLVQILNISSQNLFQAQFIITNLYVM